MVTLMLMGVVAGTVYLTLEVNNAYIKAKDFKRVRERVEQNNKAARRYDFTV